MDRIDDLQAFVAVIEKGSLTAAARQLDRSLQSVSRSLAAVERDVGIELIRRTTRRLSPTQAGLALHRRLSAALAEIEAAKAEAADARSEPRGLLRLTGSNAFAPLYLVPAISAFLAQYPAVEVDLELSDHYTDLVAEGLDLAIRIGELQSSTLKAKRLADLRRVVAASPAYFAKRGRPRAPDALRDHECIVRTAALDGDVWPFLVDGKLKKVKVGGRFRTSGALSASEAAMQGLGIVNAPLWQLRHLVDSGALELTLTRFEPPPMLLHAVWPGTPVLPAKTQLFVDFLAARLKKERL